MKLSIVVATNRNLFWRGLCDSLAKNSAQMEVFFVGPIGIGEPGLPVPSKFIDVQDPTIGPAQCWEIGARRASGDLLGLATDDVVYTPGFLDAVVALASRLRSAYDMFTARYVHGKDDQETAQHMYSLAAMPLLPICGFTRAEEYHGLGGIDKRFHAVLWDTDLYMHLHQLGGRTRMVEGHTVTEHCVDHALYTQNKEVDGVMLRTLWPEPFTPEMQRTDPERQRWEDYTL